MSSSIRNTVGLRARLHASLHHFARLGLSGAVIAAAAFCEDFLIGFVGGGMLLLAAFSWNHDLLHGALGGSRRVRDVGILFAGALMGMSGHAILVSHLHHHARPLDDDDLEGYAARLPHLVALLRAPELSIRLRVGSHRLSNRRLRGLQWLELALNVAGFAALWFADHPATYGVAAALALGQLTMPFWAGHVPHRVSDRVLEWVRWLVTIAPLHLSATLASLAYHDAHHRHPKVPTHRLHEVCDV